MQLPENQIVIGKITGAHGVRGELKMAIFLDDFDFLRDVKTLVLERRSLHEVKVKRIRIHKNRAILLLEGINDRNTAEQWRGYQVILPFALLPPLEEDEYYVGEIVGLDVKSIEGEWLGQVREVIFTGANEVYVVEGGPKGEILLPAIKSVIDSIDLEANELLVTLPQGLVSNKKVD